KAQRKEAPAFADASIRQFFACCLARGTRHDGCAAIAVLGPCRLVRALSDRTLFAEADGVDAGGGDAAADQVRAHGLGATGTQGQVVLARAALVGVAFDA